MTRHGPKGPPLFDVLAPRRREPSAFEVAIQAALAQQPGGDADHGAPPEQLDEDRATDASEAGSAGRSSGSHLVAVELDDEPPLMTAPIEPGPAQAKPEGPGPRIAAFAAATGAATRPRSAPLIQNPPPASETVSPDARPRVSDAGATSPTDTADVETASEPGEDKGAAWPVDRDGVSPDPREDLTVGSAGDAAADPIDPSTPTQPSAAGSAEESTLGQSPDAPPGSAFTEDDDFGPLVLPEEPARRWRRRRTPDIPEATTAPPAEAPSAGPSSPEPPSPASPRQVSRRFVGVGVAAVAASVLGLAVWQLRPADATASVSTPAPVSQAPAGDVSMAAWHGMALPVSATAGPRVRGETVSGFERSPLGAAIAAANLVVRLDPAAGPTVFEPTLATQVVGDVARLRDAVHDQAGDASDAGGPGALTGWRIESADTTDELTVHLAVDPGDGAGLDFAVPLAWVDGDWRIDAASKGAFFPTSTLSGEYMPFVQEGAAS